MTDFGEFLVAELHSCAATQSLDIVSPRARELPGSDWSLKRQAGGVEQTLPTTGPAVDRRRRRTASAALVSSVTWAALPWARRPHPWGLQPLLRGAPPWFRSCRRRLIHRCRCGGGQHLGQIVGGQDCIGYGEVGAGCRVRGDDGDAPVRRTAPRRQRGEVSVGRDDDELVVPGRCTQSVNRVEHHVDVSAALALLGQRRAVDDAESRSGEERSKVREDGRVQVAGPQADWRIQAVNATGAV